MKAHSICSLLLCGLPVFTSLAAAAESGIAQARPCEGRDLIGIWRMTDLEAAPEIKNSNDPLLSKYQYYSFRTDGSAAYLVIIKTRPPDEKEIQHRLDLFHDARFRVEDGFLAMEHPDWPTPNYFECRYITQEGKGTHGRALLKGDIFLATLPGGVDPKRGIYGMPILFRYFRKLKKLAQAPKSADGFLTFEDSAGLVRIKYPRDWQKTILDPEEGVGGRDRIMSVVGFTRPTEGPGDKSGACTPSPGEDVMVFVWHIVDKVRIGILHEVTNLHLNRLRQWPEFKLVESSSTTLAGTPAYKVVFTAVLPQLQFDGRTSSGTCKWKVVEGRRTSKHMSVWTIRQLVLQDGAYDTVAYIIDYKAWPDTYDKYLGLVQEMLSSFEIKGDAGAVRSGERIDMKGTPGQCGK